jgi:hypothetical protein
LSPISPVERPRLEGLDARIGDLVAPTLEHMGYELVRVQVSGKEKPVVQIMADRADGTTFTVEDCTEISHAVGAVLDVADPIKAEWMLEVSSPGIDRPLTRAKDWERFAGPRRHRRDADPDRGPQALPRRGAGRRCRERPPAAWTRAPRSRCRASRCAGPSWC